MRQAYFIRSDGRFIVKKIGVIGNIGSWSSEHLADVVADRTGLRCLVDASRLTLDLHELQSPAGDVDLMTFDALLVKKIGPVYSPDCLDRLEMLRYLHHSGVRVFSSPDRLLGVLNRLACTITLRLHNIPMPPTVITESPEEARRAVDRFRRAVFKPLFTSKARGMTVIESGADSEDAIERFREAGNTLMYIQKALELPGRDLGLMFVNGRYLGTYARVAGADAWNTTSAAGGHYEAAEPDDDIIELARRAQTPFGLDFTSVDLAMTPDGPVVFEVSAFGGFRGMREAVGLDVAQHFVEHVLESLSHSEA